MRPLILYQNHGQPYRFFHASIQKREYKNQKQFSSYFMFLVLSKSEYFRMD